MTKKEGNQQNLNTSFKIKLIRKPEAAWCDNAVKSQGLYQKLRSQNANKYSYNSGSFNLQDMQKVVGDFFAQRNQNQREVKIYGNKAAEELLNKALMEELKKYAKDEHRKKLSFRSKIFKQTYKFG